MKGYFSIIMLVVGFGIWCGVVYLMGSDLSDQVYLLKSVEETCPGVPELTFYNTTYFADTRVNQCSFLGYCSDRIDTHKTVEKMKTRCKELQEAQK